jgi:signal transduction histidine kinase
MSRNLARLGGRVSWPRRPVRLRFTVLYVVMFLVSGIVLLLIANSLAQAQGGGNAQPAHGGVGAGGHSPLGQAQLQIAQLQAQLIQARASRVQQLIVGSAIAMGIMAVISILMGWIAAGRVLRPLRTMTATARRISENNLHERLDVPGPADELKDLGDTIDGLLERLEGAFAAQRRFVANASHELRTPLTTMRALLDVAVAKPGSVPAPTTNLANRLRAELDQVDGLLEGFLILARAQHGALPDQEKVSLGRVASAALSARAGAIATARLTVSRSVIDAAEVDGSPTLLRSMIDNLLDNAIRHNEAGGWIQLTLEDRPPIARLVVETGGDVLDQRKVRQLNQPFTRLGADRTGPGHGLGLSIVAAVAEAHGGTVDLQARAAGGLRVTVGLPLAAEPARAGVSA